MPMQEFEGRTAAEAAIKACEVFGISRSQLDYKVLKDEGEGMERRVVIQAEPAERAAAVTLTTPRPERSERVDRGDRSDRPRNRGPARTGNRPEYGNDDEGRNRGRRGGRGRKPGGRGRGDGAQAPDDGLEKLLNLESVPAEPGPVRPELSGDLSEKATKGKEVVAAIIEKGELNLTAHVVEDGAEEITSTCEVQMRVESSARKAKACCRCNSFSIVWSAAPLKVTR